LNPTLNKHVGLLRRAGYTNVFTTMGKIVANEGGPPSDAEATTWKSNLMKLITELSD
jgi:hypothetical protein